jgi:hypothetical protein
VTPIVGALSKLERSCLKRLKRNIIIQNFCDFGLSRIQIIELHRRPNFTANQLRIGITRSNRIANILMLYGSALNFLLKIGISDIPALNSGILIYIDKKKIFSLFAITIACLPYKIIIIRISIFIASFTIKLEILITLTIIENLY